MAEIETEEPDVEELDAEEPGVEDLDAEVPGVEELDAEEPGVEGPEVEHEVSEELDTDTAEHYQEIDKAHFLPLLLLADLFPDQDLMQQLSQAWVFWMFSFTLQ